MALLLQGCAPLTEPWDPGILKLNPEPALRAFASKAAKDWSRHTGLSVTVGDFGTPVRLVGPEHWEDGPLCGETVVATVNGEPSGIKEIVVTFPPPAGCPTELGTVMHEVGHALSPEERDHPLDGTRSVMSTDAKAVERADLYAVELVCSYRECDR